MRSRTIKIDLSAQAKSTFASQFSSANYSSTAQSLLVPFDLLYTYVFRYNRLLSVDLERAEGIDVSTTQGAAIDFTAFHPAIGAIITATFATVALVTSYFHIRYLKKAKAKDSTHSIKEQLDAAIQAEKDKPQLLPIFDINYYLAKVLKSRRDLQAKYEKVAIEGDYMKITLSNQQPAPVAAAPDPQPNWYDKLKKFGSLVSRKMLGPAWEALALTSYSYWILYIGAGIFTGKFGVGVEGLTPILGFGIPIAIGLTYPLIKIYRYFKNRRNPAVGAITENEEPVDAATLKETEKNTSSLLRSALLLREFEREKAILQEHLQDYGIEDKPEPFTEEEDTIAVSKLDARIATLGQGKWKKTAVAFMATMVGTYVAAQYGAWVVSDFLNSVASITIGAPIVQIVLGTIMMVGAFSYGLYKAIERFFEVKVHATNPKVSVAQAQQKELSNLEKRLENSQKNIAELEAKLDLLPVNSPRYDQEEFLNDANRQRPTIWSSIKKIAAGSIQVINGITTGAFIARVFFVKGTAIALPFAAASLSNPITIGILVGLGLAYGAFKFYQYHQQRKEEHAKLLLEQRDERIEFLKQEVVIAGMREKLYNAMAKKMNEAASITQAKVPVPQPLTNALNHTVFARPRNMSVGTSPAVGSPAVDLAPLGGPKNRAA
jgi:hypothetical protein